MNVVIFLSNFFGLSLGTATLSYWLIYILGGNFSHFKFAAAVSFGAAGWLAAISSRNHSDDEFKETCGPVRSQPGAFGWLAASIAAAAPLIGNGWLFWLALIASSTILWRVIRKDARSEAIYTRRDIDPVPTGWLLLLAICAVVVTLISHRADADDEFYVSVAVALLDQPEVPFKYIATQ